LVPRYDDRAAVRIQGPVVVRGIVRRDGTIDNVEVIKDLHTASAKQQRRVSQWHFRPRHISRRATATDFYRQVNRPVQ